MRNTILIQVAQMVNEKVIEQFALQGHQLTGEFEKSIEMAYGVDSIEASAYKYGNYVNLGVKASEIKHPFASDRIDGLTQFVKLRNMSSDDEEAISIAYAIAYKHSTEGMPTEKSKQFSKNGKRTEFINDVFDDAMDAAIMELISEEFTINVTSR